MSFWPYGDVERDMLQVYKVNILINYRAASVDYFNNISKIIAVIGV